MAYAFQVDTGGTLTNQLISYWALEEAAGATRVDLWGANNLTDTNTVGQGTGKVGNCADFGATNTNKKLEVASNLGVDGGAISIAAWINVTTEPNESLMRPVYTRSNNNDVAYYLDYREFGGTYSLLFGRDPLGGGGTEITYNVQLTAGTWYFAVLTYDTTNLRGYLNNVLRAGPTACSGNGTGSNADAFTIGSGPYNDHYWKGMIDEVGAWSRAINTTEIGDLWNGGDGQTMVLPTAGFTGQIIIM